ncbi:fatty acid desaturase [Methylomarinum vadi]|uniref:fatty acid desaturase n=1 Tax=Methylomarinum vadi TaxID=438855 RepID=UPI0004DF8E99|nr:fatty acid desaturase [Methylomarinum vadi]
MKYLFSFVFPLCVLLFLYHGPHGIANALLWTMPLWLLCLADLFSPKLRSGHDHAMRHHGLFDLMLVLLALIQFVNIVLLLFYAERLQWYSLDDAVVSIVNLIVLRILVGTSSGSSAIIVAHELIHRRQQAMRLLGHLLLYTVCYDHFVIAHLHGHHQQVATPDDIVTARRGESFDSYWKRVVRENFCYAWRYETKRLGLLDGGKSRWLWFRHRVLQGVLIEILFVAAIVYIFGWVAAFIFLYQALAAVRLLETINYFQHWGLNQRQGKQELAWVNRSWLTQYALVGLSKHIGHHRHAQKTFPEIPYLEQGPEMPCGYFATNLWVKWHNSSYRRVSERLIKDYNNT